MFNAISWGQYGLIVFLLLVAYYAYVLAVYYRQEISALVKGRIGATNPLHAGPDTRRPAVASTLRGALLIGASIVVAPPVPVRVEEGEQQVDEESEGIDSEDSLYEETAIEQQAPVAEVALEAEANATPPTELEPASPLIQVEELSEFIDRVERGEFTTENANEAPAALENTALLQHIFTASLTRRRASLAVLEDS